MPDTKQPPLITLIVAMDRNRGIGKDGEMPWHLPDDLKHFKRSTLGKPCIMGRKTFQSLLGFLGKPLPERHSIVLTRDENFSPSGVDVAHSIDEAIELANIHLGVPPKIMIIGGGEIYRLALPLADRMLITRVDTEAEADTWFPEYDEREWEELSVETYAADDRHPHSFEIAALKRTD